MPFQTAAAGEAVLKEPGQERGVFAEGDHAIANVARRQHVELAAEASGAAAIVGHSNDRGDVDDGRCAFGGTGVVFEAVEYVGESGAAADGYDAQRGVIFHSVSAHSVSAHSVSAHSVQCVFSKCALPRYRRPRYHDFLSG